MTAPERLAKVAEAAREVRIGPFGPNARETINRGGVTHLNGSEREALAQALAPLLDEFQAEDEARGRAEYEGAITWDTTCLNCAKLLDKLYGEWSEGHKAGVREGAARVREAVEALVDEWADGLAKGKCPDGDCGSCAKGEAAYDLRAALDAAEKENHDG